MSFDWQTEDDASWDDPSFASSDPEKKPDGKRPFYRLLIPVGLLLVAFMAAGWTINQRVQTATGQVEADILASYALVEQAVVRQDTDLLQSVLSGRDGDWSTSMTQLVEAGNLTERGGLGLTLLPVTEPVTPTIEMSADLLEAEVTTIVPYAIEIGNGLTETVQLAQKAVYRAGPNRWLLSPPEPSFWGDIRRIKGQYVNLFYPERDKEIAKDLLLSLDAKIGQLCAQLADVDCPNDYQIIVELSTNPETLGQSGFLGSSIMLMGMGAEGHVILPTPTLVGLPMDKSAENALFRGYGQVAVYSILTDLWGYPCCNANAKAIAVTGILHSAVLDDALRQLGLKAWPGGVGTAVITSDYDQLFEQDTPLLFDSFNSWFESETGYLEMPGNRIDILVDFLLNELGMARPELVSGISTFFTGQTFGSWLQTLPSIGLSAQEMENAWLSFVYNQTSVAQQAPPVPLPDQDIQLLCQMGDEERMALYRYNLAANTMVLEQPLNRDADKMVALPDDNGIAVWEATDDEPSLLRLSLWVDGQKLDNSWYVQYADGHKPLHADPTNEKLILAPVDYEFSYFGLLDVSSCLGGTCSIETLEGYPIWSPDGEHIILLASNTFSPPETQAYGRLILADGSFNKIRTFAFGSSPFWLDDKTFGFISDEGEGSRHTIVTGRVDEVTRDWDTLLTVEALTAVINDNRIHLIDFVAPQPQNPNKFVIVTHVADEIEGIELVTSVDNASGQNVFIYDWVTEEILPIQPFVIGSVSSITYRFSPNGRFLLLQLFEISNNGAGIESRDKVYVIDLVDETVSSKVLQHIFERNIYWMTDFTQDGEWLLVSDEHVLYLIHPETGYERLIFPKTGSCKTAVWINKNNGS